MSKAFKPFNKSAGSSSDRTSNLRRQTMYQAVTKSQNMNKLNEYQSTNRNFSVKPCEGVSSATGKSVSQLNQTSSYRTYMDLAIGKRLVNPIINGQEALKLDGNMGAFYRLNVKANDTISTTQANNGAAPLPVVAGTKIDGQPVTGNGGNGNTLYPFTSTARNWIGGVGRISWPNSSQDDVPTSYNQFVAQNANQTGVYDNYPGYMLDPYNKLSGACDGESTLDIIRKARTDIAVDARWLESYWGATGGQPLAGFSFPSKVLFGTQETNYNDHIKSYKVAPMTQISDDNGIVTDNYNAAAFQGASSKYCIDSVSSNVLGAAPTSS